MAEARRATIRILSNYARLFATVCLGLILPPLLLRTVGDEASGLFALIASTVGFAGIIEEVAQWSMIRELGTAHHSGDDLRFRKAFNAALVVCTAAAFAILVIFAIILACLPLMQISEELMTAARWFVIAKAVETAVMVLFAPHFNMYIVLERMVSYNFWFTVRRFTVVLAAAMLLLMNPAGPEEAARGLMIFGWVSTGLQILGIGLSALIIQLQDHRLWPKLSLADRAGARAFLGISGWNAAIQSSQTLGLPAAGIIMNIWFGLTGGNLIFGWAVQLAGYCRMLASGMTMGLDAVATRMSTTGADDSVPRLVRYSTMLHGLVAFPAAIGIGIVAEPFLYWWVGGEVENPEVLIPQATTLTRILLIGFGIMCICDCWTRILYGAGHVRRYARAVILGNLLTPVLSIVLLMLMPDSIKYTAVAWAFAAVYIVFYLGALPRLTARVLNMRVAAVVGPLARPLLVAALCSPLVLMFWLFVDRWTIWWLMLSAVPYSVCYAVGCWVFVLRPEDRARFSSIAARLGPVGRLLVRRT